jgi:uncharacterized protein (UPF0276 family)
LAGAVAFCSSPLRDGAAEAPIPAEAGIGLRFPHHDQVLEQKPRVAWFEVHPENYLGSGPAADHLARVRRDYPLSLHATGLSLGSAQGLDGDHLLAVAELARRLEPGLVSDHLSWSAADGLHLPDLLPLPYTEEALAVVVRNLDQAQGVLGRALLVENPSTYLRFAGSALSEAEFLAEAARRSGCGVLLDVNNIFVSASNAGEDPGRRLSDLLASLWPGAVREIHLAGHAVRPLGDGAVLRIDDHGARVSAEVWALYEMAIAALGPRPTLIEWDTDVPALDVLIDEAAAAQTILRRTAPRRDGGGRAHAAAG